MNTQKNYETIIYEKKPPVAYITLNRPTKMNALSKLLQRECREALEDAGWQDKEIKAVVIKGAGRCFSSGFDLAEVGSEWDVGKVRASLVKGPGFDGTGFWDVFWYNPKPLIAQVHGFCLAGGQAIASFCDLCICSDDALFGYPIIRDGGPYLMAEWPWLLGMRKCKELLFTGNLMDAQEAFRLGFVNRVVPKEKLEDEVNKLVKTICKVPAIAIECSKSVINMAYDLMGIRRVLERASELEAISLCSREGNPERAEFDRLTLEKGLKAALEWRAERFAEEDSWWRNRQVGK